MTPLQQTILRDLVKHLYTKVTKSIDDFVDLCRAAGIPHEDIAVELMTFMCKMVVSFAITHFNFSLPEFLKVVGEYFHQANKGWKEFKRER